MAKFDRPRIRRKDVPEYLREVHGVDISLATLNTMATLGVARRCNTWVVFHYTIRMILIPGLLSAFPLRCGQLLNAQ